MRIYIVTIVFLLADLCAVKLWLVSPAEYLKACFGHQVKVCGYIEPLSVKQQEDRASFIMDCESLQLGNNTVPYKNKLRVYLYNKNKKAHSDYMEKQLLSVSAGKVVTTGQLEPLRSFANPGSFDMETYNWVQGLGGMVREARLENAGLNKNLFLGYRIADDVRIIDYFALINMYLRNKVKEAVANKDAAALLTGIVLGGSDELSTELRESFSNNGLSHLLSVSGTHLVLLTSFLILLLKQISSLNNSKRSIIIFMFMISYACLCGLKPPILRAVCMSTILLWGRQETYNCDKKKSSLLTKIQSQADKGKILCILCMLLLIWKPVWILDLGFQLSFGATAGLLWLLPKLKEKLGFIKIEELKEGLSVTLAAQLATLPILVGNFYTVAIISLVSNLLLVPVLELTTILTIIGMLASCIVMPVGNGILQLAAWLVEQIIVQAQWLQGLLFSVFVVGSLPIFCLVLYYAALFSWLDIGYMLVLNTMERRICIGVCCSIIGLCYLWQQWKPMPTTVYFMDVGQGDGAVIVSPEHKIAVIDTGGLKSFDTGSRIITPFLHSLGKSKVDILIPSHSDYDHIGGGVGLARNMKIEKVVLPREKLSDDGLQLMKDILKHVKNDKAEFARQDKIYDLGGASIKLISVPEKVMTGNDASTVVELKDSKTSKKVLFTGDMTVKREAELQDIGQYDVLKVGHHGSKGSTSELFLDNIKPRLAVISCGYRNLYGHPHRATLQRLEGAGCEVIRTDESGCVKVELAEEGVRVKTFKKVIGLFS